MEFIGIFEKYENMDVNNLTNEKIDIEAEVLYVIRKAFNVSESEIVDIKMLKKGMTNRSFLFTCNEKKYIMRIPGEGTDQLINRRQEAEVYRTLEGKDICDRVAFIDEDSGYKITEYLEGSRVCYPGNAGDLNACMKKLREFHSNNLRVGHEFDLFEQIIFYESLWKNKKSSFPDYHEVKENVFSLKEYIEKYVDVKCLTHIDAVPDNFLFTLDGKVKLIDWEYAGMQDPHVDIAMFCIYSFYEKNQVDELIDIYFDYRCSEKIRTKIYCYISVCGLLWSNWCEYKKSLGVEFGEYALRQYEYAKEYYKIAVSRDGELNEG